MWPIISSIISGIVSPVTTAVTAIFTKKQDAKIEEGRQDVSIIQARTTLLGQIHRDPAIAIGWYLFIVPTGLWFVGIVAYCLLHPWYPWWAKVLALPPNIEYIPYAVVTFLFGLAWRGKL
jgi:hypothetical protein